MTRQELVEQIRRKGSFLCVGLDPELAKMPKDIVENSTQPLFDFNRRIIDATAPYAVAYKPNLAFYESCGLDGLRQLDQTVAYLRANYPDVMVIADAKRGDIGNTSRMYAKATFGGENPYDAITVAPYMGHDSVKPFLEYADQGRWVILLALTSNPGSADFQMTPCDGGDERLFERVLRISQTWGTTDNMMYVVGATRGQLIEDVRRVAPHHFLLVPGVGAQGGSLAEVAKYGMTPDCGLLVNSSRGIIYAPDPAAAAADLAAQMAKLLPW